MTTRLRRILLVLVATTIAIALTPGIAAATATFVGQVTGDGGTPVPNALVRAYRLEGGSYDYFDWEGWTGPTGMYMLDVDTPGIYALVCIPPSSSSYAFQVYDRSPFLFGSTVFGPGTNEVTFGVDFPLTAGGTASGRIFDPVGHPATSRTPYLWIAARNYALGEPRTYESLRWDEITGPGFTATNLAPGEYRFVGNCYRRTVGRDEVPQDPSAYFTVTSGLDTYIGDITLAGRVPTRVTCSPSAPRVRRGATTRLTLRLYDADDGLPLRSRRVTVKRSYDGVHWSTRTTLRTNSAGRAYFTTERIRRTTRYRFIYAGAGDSYGYTRTVTVRVR